MESKICTKCLNKKPLSGFYLHPETADKHFSSCKECVRKSSAKYSKSEKGREAIKGRCNNPKWRTYYKQWQKKDRIKNPGRIHAYNTVRLGLGSGKLTKMPCEVCGNLNVEAHHDDYLKPLDVRWLCKKHHSEIRKVSF
jgi:hypothetical protein